MFSCIIVQSREQRHSTLTGRCAIKLLTTLTAFVLISGTTSSATIYVPDNYPTIQDAIVAAVTGDEIIIRPGTYVENIDFIGKTISLKSESGPHVTTIDGGQPTNPDRGSVVSIESGEGPGTLLEGFTITNGSGNNDVNQNYYGGGVLCYYSSPTIRNNIISGNTASNGYGGGIYARLSTTVPTSWISGSEHPLQALVGPWGGPWTWLTNAEALVVE